MPFFVRRQLALASLCLLVLGCFAASAVSSIFGAGFLERFNSDAAVPALLASEVLRTGQLVPTTWYYANSEIWLLAPHLAALPAVAIFGASMLSVKVSVLLSLAVAIISMTVLIQEMSHSWTFALIGALAVFSPFSAFQREMLYVESGYAWIAAQMALLTYLTLRQVTRTTGGHWLSIFSRADTLAYVGLLLLFAASSPLRMAVFWAVPLFAALAMSFRDLGRRAVLAIVYASLSTIAVGALIHLLLLSGRPIFTGVSSMLAPVGAWSLHLANLGRGIRLLLGDFPSGIQYAGLPWTLAAFLRWAFAGLAIAAAVYWSFASRLEKRDRFLSRLTLAMLLAGIATLTISTLGDNVAAVRYLQVQLLMLLAALIANVWTELANHSVARTVAALAFALAFVGGGWTHAVIRPAAIASVADCGSDQPCALALTLREHGLQHGYATYWNANSATVAADESVSICGIHATPPLSPLRWLTSARCFDPAFAANGYFIALTRSELRWLDSETLQSQAGPPRDVLHVGQFEVWVYAPGSRVNWLQN